MKSINVIRFKIKTDSEYGFILALSKLELQESQLSHKIIQTGVDQFTVSANRKLEKFYMLLSSISKNL